MKFAFLVSFLLSWALACQSGGGNNGQYYEQDAKQVALESSEQDGRRTDDLQTPVESAMQKKIIRDGSMRIEVGDISKAKQFVDTVITRYQGRASGEQYESNDYQATYYLKIRIAAGRLDSLIADLEKIEGSVVNKSLQARDVTEEYIDLETRMTNKRSYLEQYRQLLKTSKSTEDILKISERMRQIEEELESVEGRLRYLSDQVALSTLELHLYQTRDYKYKPDRRIDFIERFKESVSDGWHGFVTFLLLLVRLWPFIIALVGLVLLLRLRPRKQKPEDPKKD
jgi:hypothetical protein